MLSRSKHPYRNGCLASLLVVVAAFFLQKLIWSHVSAAPFLLFYPAIFLSAWLGGKRCGYLTTALSVIVVDYAFFPPYNSFGFSHNWLSESIFLGVGLAITIVIAREKESHALASDAAVRLREQKKMYDTLLDATEDHVFLLDRELRFVYINRSTEKVIRAGLKSFGQDPAQPIIGKTNRELGYPDELLIGFERDAKRALTGETIRYDLLHPAPGGQRTFEYVLVPVFEADGRVSGVTGFSRDVHDRKQAEEARKRSEETLQLAMRAAKIGIFEMDLRSSEIPVQWSERQYEIFGVKRSQDPISYEIFKSRIFSDDLPKVEEEFAAAIRESRDFNLTYRVQMEDGKIRWVRGNARAFRDSSGALLRMLGTNMDVTESVEAQEEISRALKAREEMLAIVSHDLRNPLGSILMSAAMIKRKSSQDEAFFLDQAAKIQRAGQRMNDLIEDLLNLAKMESGNFTLTKSDLCGCNMIAEAVEIMTPLAQEKRIRIETQGSEQNLRMSCDHNQVLRVFSNLIGNAIKFTPEHGLIRISAEDRDTEVLFSVSDTGPGIAQHDLPHVFDRFWQASTTKHMGTGLGLSISKGIVAAHGGKIWVESRFGEGATFYFSLPKAGSEKSRKAA